MGAVATATLAVAALPQQQGSVDLLTQANVTINGPAGAQSGWSVRGAGDVNGDGIDDIVIGGPKGDPAGRTDAGIAWVVFGSASPVDVSLASLGSSGFRVDGAAAGDQLGTAVSAAGDVNDDGLADLMVGAPYAAPSGRSQAGSTYVVYGSRTPTDLDLGTGIGSRGFRIDGAAMTDRSGVSVDGAGDVNDDGIDDVVLGAYTRNSSAGAAYVVFGSAGNPGTVDLNGAYAGFAISGASSLDYAGTSVAGGGDVNDDGIADVVVGATGARDDQSGNRTGAAYAIFGSANPTSVSLASLGSRGVKVTGAASGDNTGASVDTGTDVNGDGIDDVAIGANGASPSSRVVAGSGYVVYGSASLSNLRLASLGQSQGLRMNGAAASDQAGKSIGMPGDVNADGFDDVVIGAPFAAALSRAGSGAAYVVFGASTVQAAPIVELGSLGVAGITISGARAGDDAGYSVGAAGDLNADGRPDVVVGADLADPPPGTTGGSSYVIYGFGASSVAYPAALDAGIGSAITAIQPTVARTGVAMFSVAPPLPAGLALDPQTGVIAGTPSVASPRATYVVTMNDLTGSVTASLDIEVAGAPSPPAPAPTPPGTADGATQGGAADGPAQPAVLRFVAPTVTVGRGSQATLTTRVAVASPGRLAQVGRTQVTARRTVIACATSRTVRAPGTYTLRCRLRPAARRALTHRALRVRLATSMRTADGQVAARRTVTRIGRTVFRPVPVTG